MTLFIFILGMFFGAGVSLLSVYSSADRGKG